MFDRLRNPGLQIAVASLLALAAATAAMHAAAEARVGQSQVKGKVGTKAPPFKVTLLDGTTIDSKALLGKVVVLKFWYVACGPCRQEIPHLNPLVEEFAGQPVVFLAPALDAPEKIRLFLQEMPFRYQVVPNAETLVKAFGDITVYPVHIVIDKRGTIVHFAAGGSLETPNVLRPIITAALAVGTGGPGAALDSVSDRRLR